MQCAGHGEIAAVGRDENAVSLLHRQRLPGAGHLARAVHNEQRDKAVRSRRAGKAVLVHVDGEVLALGQMAAEVMRFGGLALRHRQRLRDVQGARLSVRAHAAVIVHAVRHVGILLDLRDDDPLADRVQRAGGNEEHVTLVHRRSVQHLGEGVVLDPALKFLTTDLVIKPVIEERARLTVENIPHFRLAVLVLVFERVLVGRMDLNGQVALCVNQLGEDGKILEFPAILAQNLFAVFCEISGKRLSVVLPSHNDGGAVRVAGKHPRFSQRMQVAFDAEGGAQLVASPEIILTGGFQFQHGHDAIILSSWKPRRRPVFH